MTDGDEDWLKAGYEVVGLRRAVAEYKLRAEDAERKFANAQCKVDALLRALRFRRDAYDALSAQTDELERKLAEQAASLDA